jgi:hypothetical protein
MLIREEQWTDGEQNPEARSKGRLEVQPVAELILCRVRRVPMAAGAYLGVHGRSLAQARFRGREGHSYDGTV